MYFQQGFYLIWSALELFMSLTHLFVLLGFRNSNLKFLRRQQNYFLLDGFMHLINVLLYYSQDTSNLILLLWIYAFIVHIYYYRNLVVNPLPPKDSTEPAPEDNTHKLSPIFHWSCLEYKNDRFDLFQSGKQIIETFLDVTAHFIGFLFAFNHLQSIFLKMIAMVLMAGLFYRQMLNLKYFVTDPKMMPASLRRYFKAK